MKQCFQCGEDKPLDLFSRSSKAHDGLSYYCRPCISKRRKISAGKLKDNPPELPKIKRCYKCREVKQASEFFRSNDRADGLRGVCKVCQKAYFQSWSLPDKAAANAKVKAWYHANKEKIAHRQRKKVYGLEEEQYQAMFTRQGGNCLLCNKPPGKKPLAVDHNHETGKVRSLLCSNCNLALGLLRENPVLIRRAADYIEFFARVA